MSLLAASVSVSIRLTEKPIRIGFTVIESAANTVTVVQINLPTIPSIALARGKLKALAVEVMKVATSMQPPDTEAGQGNNFAYELIKGAAPTSQLGMDNQRVIHSRIIENKGVEVTAVGEIFDTRERNIIDDLTDGDGNGEIVADNEIHVLVEGTGNANVKRVRGYMLVHLIEIDTEEAIFELIETQA